MTKKLSKPFLLLTAGILLFLLAVIRLQMEAPAPNLQTRTLARVESRLGEALLDRRGQVQKLSERQILQRLDQIETQSESEVLLTFANGEEVRLLENSLALLDFEAGRPVVILKAGDVWVEKAKDDDSSALISRQGIRRSLTEDFQEKRRRSQQSASDNSELGQTPGPQAAVPPPRPLEALPTSNLQPAPTRLESLTADYIQDTLRSQRNLFFRCYTQLLQKSPGLRGDASLAFTIEKNGRVRQAEVSSSSLRDPAFQSCLSEAMKRVEFKSFAGEPVSALFPLKFE